MEASYDPGNVARIFDEYGEQEWDRHEAAGFAKVAFHLHRKYLAETIRPGDRVLEAGAGPGRFTIELARLGASVVVGDVSPDHLELNRQHAELEGLERHVERREMVDVLDLSRFADGSFDAVVCCGGPLSYVLDGAARGLDELIRVTRLGGHVLLSVMSTTARCERTSPDSGTRSNSMGSRRSRPSWTRATFRRSSQALRRYTCSRPRSFASCWRSGRATLWRCLRPTSSR
jgi:SAM-dependent methyltransferase